MDPKLVGGLMATQTMLVHLLGALESRGVFSRPDIRTIIDRSFAEMSDASLDPETAAEARLLLGDISSSLLPPGDRH
jgi:hypothetical protein